MRSLTIYENNSAYLDSSNPTTTYSPVAMGRVGVDIGATRRELFKFVLSSIPSDAIIDSAILYLKTGAIFPGDAPISISLYRVTGAWTPSTVAWDTQPAISETAYGTKNVSEKSTPAYEAFDITTLLAALIENSGDSIAVRETVEGTGGASLYVYGSGGGADYRAYMVIEYETPIPSDPVIDAIPTVTADEKEFTWGDSTCDIFESAELFYEFAVSLDGGATYGSTLTSAEGDAAYTINFRTYLGIGASQYYYNANVKIKVRAKTPEYEGEVYYSEWVESSAFAISYPTPAPTPVYADDSGIIDAYWYTPETDFGHPDAEKTLDEIAFIGWGTTSAGAAGGQVKFTVYYNLNGVQQTYEFTQTLGTTRTPYYFPLTITGRLFKVKIENVSGSAINISGLKMVFELDEDV